MSASYEQKLDRARKLSREAGLKLSYDVPPVLRIFGKLGLPVRPIHFMSASSLFAYYFFVLGAVFLGIYWLVSALDFNRWVLIKIKEMGPVGALALAACLALFDTVMVRAQAKRSGLSDWNDL
jgi:apolipoprotein N-acyltransferase